MRVLVACKRGTSNPPRNRHGHCLCGPCTEFNRARSRRNNKNPAKLAWKAANKDKMTAYAKDWAERNPEQRRAIVENWRARNPDKVAAMSAKAGARWSKENSGKRNAITRKRQAAKLQRTPKWADLQAIQSVYVEAAALTRATGIPHEVDHILPLQGETVSGLHVASNLQIIPRSTNRAKRNSVTESA